MQGWVESYVGNPVPIGVLNSLEESRQQHVASDIISKKLIEDLNCHFGTKNKQTSYDFFFMFASVLADLPRAKFDRLRSMKNHLFIFGSNTPGYVRYCNVKDKIPVSRELNVVVFGHSVSTDWKAGRGIIVHELIHIIEELTGSDCE